MKKQYILKYSKEAPDSLDGWEKHSLPIGNGFQGANIFGGATTEEIYFSEESLWTGGPVADGGVASYVNGDFLGLTNRHGKTIDYRSVERAKKAALGRSNKAVTNIFVNEILPGNREALGAFQSFAICRVHFSRLEDVKNYCRSLNLNQAVAEVHYTSNGILFDREYFASYPKHIIAAKYKVDGCGKLNFFMDIEIPHTENPNSNEYPEHYAPENYGKIIKTHCVKNGNTLIIEGALRQNGLRFAMVATVVTDGRCVEENGGIRVFDASEAVIYFSYGTNYLNDFSKQYRTEKNPLETARQRIKAVLSSDYETVKKEHLADYQPLFERVDLHLCDFLYADMDTDELLKNYGNSKYDRYLEELYFQYGRYLLLSSSREGTLPANLQGVWNAYQFPPWSSDYHLNINLQMNYWPAMRTNLPETVMPLLEYIEGMRKPGRICAKTLFGLENNWCFMLASNIFGYVGLGNTWDLKASGFPMWVQTCFAWMCHSIYEIYLYYNDFYLLRDRIYPLLRECAEFYAQILVFDPRSDRMVISPSYSAEHGGMLAGCTFEQELVWQLFEDCLNAAKILGDSASAFCIRIAGLQKRLQPLKRSKLTGGIKEWYIENPISNPHTEHGHRHISHLVGLFPGNHITKENSIYFKAAKISLRNRGNKGTGWSRANKIGLNARLLNGEKAYRSYRSLIKNCTLPNLWDTHPPFQIDGNFGGTAGVSEMLLQCSGNILHPLAALPKAWRNGKVCGLSAYGGVTVDMQWNSGRLSYIKFYSKSERDVEMIVEKRSTFCIKTPFEKRIVQNISDKLVLHLFPNFETVIMVQYDK